MVNTKSDKNEIRFKDLEVSPHRRLVSYPGHLASPHPIFSKGYSCCNAVVLLNCKGAGLSHYSTSRSCLYPAKPEEYVPKLIEETLALEEVEGDLSAVLVGGDPTHFERNMRVLEDNGILIIGEGYLDGWEDGKSRYDYPKDIKEKMELKKILVSPSTQEVLLFSRPVGFVKLN